MNCQEFEQIISDLARNRLTDMAARQHGQAHASACARCAARWQKEGQLSRGLQYLAQADQRAAHAPAYLEANLLATLRRQHSASQPTPTPARFRLWWPQAWAWAAAALALAVLLPLGWWRSGAAQEQPVLVATLPPAASATAWLVPDNLIRPAPAAAAPPVTSGVVTPPRRAAMFQPVALRTAPARKKVTQRARPEVAFSHAPEVVTEFFPLNNADALPVTDELHRVRVRLPRSALAEFGLLVNERAGARVTADVLIGADGLARAVRFVR